MKFLSLTILVILSLSVAYRIRKDPMTASRGAIQPQASGQLTTNYNEMVNDQSKRLVTIGLPENIDLDNNVAIGDSYEDVVYVKPAGCKKAGKKNAKSSSRFAKKTADVTERDVATLLEVDFDDEPESAEDALRALSRHEDTITEFLEQIKNVAELSETQEEVVRSLSKYVKLVQRAHDELKNEEEDAELLNQIQSTIHKFTFLLDQHDVAATAQSNSEGNLVGPSQESNEDLLSSLDDLVERELHYLDSGNEGEYDQLITAEQIEFSAQRASKIIQTRALRDLLDHLHVQNDLDGQREQLEHYRAQLRAEKKRVVAGSLRLDELDQIFTENEELTAEQIQTFVDEEILPVKTRQAAADAIAALEAEPSSQSDEEEEENVQAETKLDLVRHDLRDLLRKYAASDALLTQQIIKLLQVADALNESDIAETDDLLSEILDEVYEDQEVILGSTQVSDQASQLQRSIRGGNFKQAATQVQELAQFVRDTAYEGPSEARLDDSLSHQDELDRRTRAEVAVLSGLTKAGADLATSEDRQQAEDFIEQIAEYTQQLVKIQKFRNAQVAVAEAGDDEQDLLAALDGLSLSLKTEAENLNTDRSQMANSQETVQSLLDDVSSEEWEDNLVKANTIVEEENLNAKARWAVKTAAQYFELDTEFEVVSQLEKALDYVQQDLDSLDRSIEAVERQQELLEEAEEAANDGDSEGVAEALEKLIHSIQTRQSVVEVSVEVEANAEAAAQLLADEKWEEAADAIRRISRDLVDPNNRELDDVHERAEEQEEGNGVESEEGLDIRDNNRSPAELALEDTVNRLDALVESATEALEENDRAASFEALENLHNFAQREYKNLDIQTTVGRVNNAEEVGLDGEAFTQALEDFRNSNSDEVAALEEKKDALKELRGSLEELVEQFEDDNNSALVLAINDLLENENADSAVRAQLDNALEFLDTNERDQAEEAVENAITRVREQEDAVESSLDSLEEQEKAIKSALSEASDSDADGVLDQLDRVSELVAETQKVVLTDTKLAGQVAEIAQQIRDGAFDEAAEGVEEIAEALTKELHARREADLADPTEGPSEELLEEQAELLQKDIENAEEAVQNGEKEEAFEAIQRVEQEVQHDAKYKLVHEVREQVDLALHQQNDPELAQELVQSLIAQIETEKVSFDEAAEEIQELVEQIQEVIENSNSENESELEEAAEEIAEEAEEVEEIPSQVLEVLGDAADVSDEEELEEKLEEAVEGLEEEQQQLEKNSEAIDSQIQALNSVLESIHDEDSDKALVAMINVADNIQNQPEVKISEEASKIAEEAIEAVKEEDGDEAAELIEDIVTAADEDVQDALEEAGIEVSSESESEFEGDEKLHQLVEALKETLQAEEVDAEAVLNQLEELKSYEGAQELEVQIAQIEIAIKSEDFATAIEFLDALFADEEEENSADTLRFSKNTKAIKKANLKISQSLKRTNTKLDAFKHRFQRKFLSKRN